MSLQVLDKNGKSLSKQAVDAPGNSHLRNLVQKASSQTQSYARNLRTLVLDYKGEGLKITSIYTDKN